MNKTTATLSLSLLALLCVGCAGSSQAVAWDDSMKPLFSGSPENSTSHPRHLWSRADEERLLKHMGYADAAVVGTVKVVTQCDRYGKRQVSLELQVKEVLHGNLDDDEKLRISTDQQTHESTVRTARSDPGARFLVFLKRKPAGETYEFYRPRPRLMAEVRSMYARL